MSQPDLDLHIQFDYAHPELNTEAVTLWVRTTLHELQALYAQSQDLPPYQAVALGIRFCDRAEALELNQTYRHKDYAPNVLSFEYGIDPTGTLNGDIIICVPVLMAEALEQHKTLSQHAAHLCIHGVLHTFGYDHIDEADAEDMEALEIHVLQQLHIANPYLTT